MCNGSAVRESNSANTKLGSFCRIKTICDYLLFFGKSFIQKAVLVKFLRFKMLRWEIAEHEMILLSHHIGDEDGNMSGDIGDQDGSM